MTSVDFHFNVTDKAGLLSVLVQRALQREQQVMITVPDERAATDLSRALWQHVQTSFLPHALIGQDVVAPVLIHWGNAAMQYDEILINLAFQQPSGFSRFKQLVELVGLDEQEKVAARQRYKFYRDRGYSINHFDQAMSE
ncbi:MAG TPA: DNA polymerase III subunit chi [Methylophilus sp.]|nr:DNA polymerase III subunit chi [Rugosibacter sp.]HQN64975.1 DNA polymerase III subunit chi [Methylophilus sp.]HQQ32745.1 DNA polymerase III subunit chi [Methylophilus sp.]